MLSVVSTVKHTEGKNHERMLGLIDSKTLQNAESHKEPGDNSDV